MRDLCDFLDRHPRLFVLSGAGISTDSGIPGYRDAEGRWLRSPPVLLQDFLRHESARRRYWARSMAGWPMVRGALPNAAHAALARLEAQGRVEQVVTQNVDGLHQRAGSSRVIELHGSISRVVCLGCGVRHSRRAIQDLLEAGNPHWNMECVAAPDGDANLESSGLTSFRVPQCPRCAGMLKPDVVFFGEGVPRERVEAGWGSLSRADGMLVIGSSLMVYSGYRFCEWAAAMGKPIAAVNLGRTRADHLFSLKVESSCSKVFGWLAEQTA